MQGWKDALSTQVSTGHSRKQERVCQIPGLPSSGATTGVRVQDSSCRPQEQRSHLNTSSQHYQPGPTLGLNDFWKMSWAQERKVQQPKSNEGETKLFFKCHSFLWVNDYVDRWFTWEGRQGPPNKYSGLDYSVPSVGRKSNVERQIHTSHDIYFYNTQPRVSRITFNDFRFQKNYHYGNISKWPSKLPGTSPQQLGWSRPLRTEPSLFAKVS